MSTYSPPIPGPQLVICRAGATGANVYPTLGLAAAAARRQGAGWILIDGAVTEGTPDAIDVTDVALLGRSNGASMLTLGNGASLVGLGMLDCVALVSASNSPIIALPAGLWILRLRGTASLFAGNSCSAPMIHVSRGGDFLSIEIAQFGVFFRSAGRVLQVDDPASAFLTVGAEASIGDGCLDGDGSIEVDDVTGQSLGIGNAYISLAQTASDIHYY